MVGDVSSWARGPASARSVGRTAVPSTYSQRNFEIKSLESFAQVLDHIPTKSRVLPTLSTLQSRNQSKYASTSFSQQSSNHHFSHSTSHPQPVSSSVAPYYDSITASQPQPQPNHPKRPSRPPSNLTELTSKGSENTFRFISEEHLKSVGGSLERGERIRSRASLQRQREREMTRYDPLPDPAFSHVPGKQKNGNTVNLFHSNSSKHRIHVKEKELLGLAASTLEKYTSSSNPSLLSRSFDHNLNQLPTQTPLQHSVKHVHPQALAYPPGTGTSGNKSTHTLGKPKLSVSSFSDPTAKSNHKNNTIKKEKWKLNNGFSIAGLIRDPAAR